MKGQELKRLATILSSNVDKIVDPTEHAVRLCNYVDAYYNDRIRPDMIFSAGSASAREIERFRLRPGDVIVTKDSEDPWDIAVPSLVEASAPDLVCGYHLAILRSGTQLLGGYLFYALLAKPIRDELSISAQGITRYGLTLGALGRVRVPLPDLDTQKAIAAFLDRETARIDQLIEKKQRLVALVSARFDAQVRGSVTLGINSRSSRLIESGVDYLGDVPEHWSVERTGWRYSVQLGKMLDGSKQTGKQRGHYLRVADVQWDQINTDDLPTMDFDPLARDRYSLASGDLLVNEGGSYVGRSAIWRGELDACFYQKALHRLRPRAPGRDTSDFFLWVMWFATKAGIFVANGNQTTIDHLTAEALRRYRFAFPPKGEQEQIAKHLRQARTTNFGLSRAVKTSITRLREHRAALITAAVTGQIDVTRWSRHGGADRRLDQIQEELAG